MLIIVVCLFRENKSLSLKPTIKMLTFQLNFVLEVYLMNLELQMELCMTFQSITILLINMAY